MNTIKDNKALRSHFSPSVNIIRDFDGTLSYIPTPNARQAFTQIVSDYDGGSRSFALVGAYGIGKSAFLWAFERTLNHKEQYFDFREENFSQLAGFEVFRIIGEHGSLKSAFAKELSTRKTFFDTENVFDQLQEFYNDKAQGNTGLLILVDEFGKFLEYAATNNPESELYFIQQLAEFANDSQKEVIFISTLHQDFNGYSRALTGPQQKEWDKVKGRLAEISFNEPVEQLLFLASERIPQLHIQSNAPNHQELFKAIESSKTFPLRDYFSEEIATRLLPFDILAAAVLTLALQKYGQNERSLFSFIESNHHFGIRDFSAERSAYYNLANVYDYLIQNHYSFLTTKYNPHYIQWAAIRVAIERVDGLFSQQVTEALAVVKTIGLLSIFGSASAKIDIPFLSKYGIISLGIERPEEIIQRLEALKIIRFVRYSSKYILFEGTDLDIELAIDEAGNFVERITNVVHHLNKHFDFPYLAAKASFYETGTPRIFAFHLSEVPEKLAPSGEVDGFVNLIFSDRVTENEVAEISRENKEGVLYGLHQKSDHIRALLFEIEKIEKVKQNNSQDRVAIRELDAILQHQVKLLNHYVLDNMYDAKSSILWYFDGTSQNVNGQKSFNRLLSHICDTVYPFTPIFRNEMVNKTKLSAALSVAKKNLLQKLTERWNERDLGFEVGKFPPERTVYLSLLRENGIHRRGPDGYFLTEPFPGSFSNLWQACSAFLSATKNGKRDLAELSEILSSRPFKLKKGLIDFWLPIFLFARRDDFALFGREGYIPYLTDNTLDLISRAPKDFAVKAFDVEGVKLDVFNRYRELLNQAEESSPNGKTFIETIRPFLTFYRDLPEYAKSTKKISKRAQTLREAIQLSQDPEQTFFDNFPKALGFTMLQLQRDENQLELFVVRLKESIKEIRTIYDELLNKFENLILDEGTDDLAVFPVYKVNLQNRFLSIKNHLLSPKQRVFIQRVNSELDDRRAWLNSIAQACIGKSLDTFKDYDEELLFEKFKEMTRELDNLCEIGSSGFDETNEVAFKLEVTSLVKGLQRNLVRLPKSKNKAFANLQSSLKSSLTSDKQLNIATLAKLLEELLTDEK